MFPIATCVSRYAQQSKELSPIPSCGNRLGLSATSVAQSVVKLIEISDWSESQYSAPGHTGSTRVALFSAAVSRRVDQREPDRRP